MCSGPGDSTFSCQAPESSGSSSWTISAYFATAVTGRAHCSSRLARSEPWSAAATKGLPPRFAKKVSATSAFVRGSGGGAGTSSLRAALVTIALTIPMSADWTTARASGPGSAALTAPGSEAAKASSRSLLIMPGIHWTMNSPRLFRFRLFRRFRIRCNLGTILP